MIYLEFGFFPKFNQSYDVLYFRWDCWDKLDLQLSQCGWIVPFISMFRFHWSVNSSFCTCNSFPQMYWNMQEIILSEHILLPVFVCFTLCIHLHDAVTYYYIKCWVYIFAILKKLNNISVQFPMISFHYYILDSFTHVF